MSEINCIHHGAHEARIQQLEKDVCELDSARENHTEFINKLSNKIDMVDQSSKRAHERLSDQEEQTKAMVETATAVKVISSKIEELIESIKHYGARIDILERQPANDALEREKRAKQRAFDVVVTAIITGGIAYIVSLAKLV